MFMDSIKKSMEYYEEAFDDDAKISAFNKIAENYYNANFSSMSKSDLETLLFSEYIDACIRKGMLFDDYTLSKNLGITQNRIRSLKERKELKYPAQDFKWEESFALSLKNVKYDAPNHRVKVIVEDVNVLIEVRHFIEQNGWYDEYQLNKKLLQIPLDCFLEICLKLEENNIFTDEAKENIKKIEAKNPDSVKKLLADFSKQGLKSFAMNAGKEILLEALKILPFGGIASTAINLFIKSIKDM